MTRYQEARQSRIFVDKMTSIPTSIRNEQDELLSFAYDVVRGMDFLAERKFCHPVLTTHKVLLTEDGRCKLYDIFPEAMAMLKVKQELNQEYPPVAWLAPEAIFMSDYTIASDVWNYAVLLWEVFSLGAIPYAGFRRSQMEENIRNGNVLLQPINCPGALYNVMLTCWNMSKDKRPLIGSVKRQLQSAFDSFNEQYPAKISEGGTIYETCE
ncbi:hypothetical protein BSL78_28382 [Apostichopus japonicus]|uniref:Protein kinase domain-containing protein n=1 Tax=Stichopus japonicus TaxID=307972 RepID=A0A2G8JGB6_STIJA|nr:hypothetical protein BSL78_28382 [Apostichopus japonicus]